MPHPSTGPDEAGGTPSLSTSKSLLDRARGGDATAWDRLSALYAPLLFHWCLRRGLREADAADIVQDVFQAVATHLGPFRKQEAADTFRGWLRTIAENKIRDHFRRTARETDAVGGTEAQHRLSQVPAPADPSGATGDDDWDGLFYRRVLELVRGEFEERTWQAFWRTAVEGRDAGDVGDELAMSRGAVRVAKSRVLRRLRQELSDPEPPSAL